jgi:dTDP-4-amino-4,6-dideoxy-D-glucose acyltransferase
VSYYSQDELSNLSLMTSGKNVNVSTDVRIYGAGKIIIGDNVRIDAFCILATGDNGYINIGSHIHIASDVALYGGGGISIGNFCTISSKCTLYSVSDDYSGEYLIGPQISKEFLKVERRPIILEKYSAIGAHSLVLPGTILREGSVLGSMSLATRELQEWKIYAGIPAKFVKDRKKNLIEKADTFKKKMGYD